MNKKPFICLIFFSAFVLVLVCFSSCGSHSDSEVDSKTTLPQPVSDQDKQIPFKMTGIKSASYLNGKLHRKFSAAELKIAPRKFAIFNIKKINEMVADNVQLELHIYPETENDPDLFSFGQSVITQNNRHLNLGLITRGLIEGLSLKIFKNDQLYFLATCQKGLIDLKKKKTKLSDVTLEFYSPRKTIVSSSVTWDHRNKTFHIPGNYTQITSEGPSFGKNLNFSLLRISGGRFREVPSRR